MLKIQKLFDAFIILYFLNIIQIKEVKKLKKNIWVVIFIITVLGCKNSEKKAPVAAIKPDTLRIHGVELIDNYSWLRDDSRNNEEVLKYIEAENQFTESFKKKSLVNRIYDELISRIDEEDTSVPYRHDYYYYYSRQEKGKQYNIYCRKKGSLDAEEEIILDMNKLSEGKKFFSLGTFEISPNHRFLAYSIDESGMESYKLYIKDLFTNEIIESVLEGVSGISWANDNATIFYCREDISGRTDRVFRHKIGNDPQEDKLLFTEKDGAFYAWTNRSKSGKYIFITTGSKTTSETWYLSADEPEKDPKLFAPRIQNEEYYVSHHPDGFYIETNKDNSPNFKVMKTEIDKTDRKYWQEYIPHREDVQISLQVFKNFLVLSEESKGIKNYKIINLENGEENYLPQDEEVYSIWSGSNKNFDTEIFRFATESLIKPYAIKTYNVYSKEIKVLKQKKVIGGYNPNNYQSERIYATADDGTKIPISIVYNKNTFSKNGKDPLLLEAYGSYGDSFDPYFSTNRITLLSRGFVYAIAHVRGGDEMGNYWYEQGKMMNKKNTFTDFITCAEYLIINDYTNSEKLAAEGGSAGGLLMGAITNLRPDLFQSIIADVPFVDITNTMLDPNLSAVVSEYEEWGNPHIKEQFDYILSYDPYQNVTAKDYPNILVIAGFYDTRVNYWEPAKWVAKLRANKTDDNLILLYTNMNAGHSGASGRYDYYQEVALKYAFLFKTLKVMY